MGRTGRALPRVMSVPRPIVGTVTTSSGVPAASGNTAYEPATDTEPGCDPEPTRDIEPAADFGSASLGEIVLEPCLHLVQGALDGLARRLAETEFVVVDLETTGGSPADAAITEIGAVRTRGVLADWLGETDWAAGTGGTAEAGWPGGADRPGGAHRPGGSPAAGRG